MLKFSDLSAGQLRNYQVMLANMLDQFGAFCQAHHLTYYLTYGSCLGAARPGGFIPWDDDLDVAMPRPDYEKLCSLWPSGGRYVLCRTTPDACTRYHIAVLRDSATTCVYPHSADIDTCHGIKMDICPLDGCPDGKLRRGVQSACARLFALFAAQRVPNQARPAVRACAVFLLFVFRPARLRAALWTWAERQVSRYDYHQCAQVRSLNSAPFPRSMFGAPAHLRFEGAERPVPRDWDAYLRRLYGDYAKMPPESERRPATQVLFLDLDKAYTAYEGIYYGR